jgi:aspartate racemase
MKTIGILGGMSWESTLSYYRLINQGVRDRLGGLHSASIILRSVDFAPVAELQAQDAWDTLGEQLAAEARLLEHADADALLLATNTMHMVADHIRQACSIPLLHIGDATGAAIQRAGLQSVGLLGTRFTMEQAFFRQHMEEGFGLNCLIPNERDRADMHRIIFDELCRGIVSDDSRRRVVGIMADLQMRGADGIVLGCTEIGLLIRAQDVAGKLFDTTELHTQFAIEQMFAN